MASRTLSVALRALVQGYTGPMRQAAAATGPLEASLMRVQRAGDGLARVGSTLTSRVTLPIVAVGAVATKMALDFDKSFTRMQTLAGVTGDEVEGLKDRVLDLAGETGRAPQELAEALYFLRSSGLDSAQAMEALEASAKASAVGLGDTATVADAVSSAMLAYAKSGLTAADATDVLIATARAGKAEPAELASQMGRLLPIASELGISFADVGGAVAALSTRGNDAERSTTQLTNVMSKLLKPSQQAEQMLAGVGLSLNDVRAMIAERGLLGTLEELRARLGESGFTKYFEDVQAVQGALSLLGGDLDQTRQIFEEVNNSVGATDEAFAIWADSMGAKNAQAFGEFQKAMIRLGDAIAPLAADIGSFVAGIAEGFSNLPKPVQNMIVTVGVLVAALGPMLSIGGNLARTFATVSRALDAFIVPAGTVAGAFNTTGTAATGAASGLGRLRTAAGLAAGAAGIGALAFALIELGGGIDRVSVDVDGLTAAMNSNDEALRRQIQGFILAADHFGDLGQVFSQVLDQSPKQAEEFIRMAEAAGLGADKIEEMREAVELKRGADAQGQVDQAAYAAEVDAAAGALEGAAEATEDARTEAEKYADTLRAQFDPLFGMVSALQSNRDAQAGFTEAQKAYNDAVAEFGANSPQAAAAALALNEAQVAAGESALDVTSAALALNDAIAKNPALLQSSKDQLAIWADQGLLTEDQAANLGAQFDLTAGKADNMVGDYNLNVTETGNRRTQDQLHRTTNEAMKIPPRRNVTATATDRASNVLRRILSNIGALHDKTVMITTVHRTLLSTPGAAEALRSTGRQHGGPVFANRLYEVAEDRRAELLEMAGRTYLIPGSDGRVVPAGPMTAAGMMNGAGGPGGSYVDNRVINVHTGADPQQVVDALKRYERRNGSVPIRVS